jgi:hypothetical protein
MKKNLYVKLSLFFIICGSFVVFLIFYANALPKNGSDDFRGWFHFNFKHHSRYSPTDTIAKSFSVVQGGVLYIDADGANIDVDTWDNNEVRVFIEKSGDEERIQNYKVTFSATPNRVEVYAKNERNIWNWDNFTVNITVKVPRNFHPELYTSGGNISIYNLDGNIGCRTSGGDIKTENTKGIIKANTSGGEIKIYQALGNINIETSGGNLKLKSIDGMVFGSTSGGDIEMELTGENKGVILKTSGGNIKTYIPANTKANLDCSTSGGSVKLKVPGGFSGSMEDSEINGTLNGGGNEFKLRTSGGNITITTKDSN